MLIPSDTGEILLHPNITDHAVRVVLEPLAGGEAWVALASPGTPLRVNGQPLLTGVRVLADRDELQIMGRGRAFFSNERLARITPYSGPDEVVTCARCQQPIERGMVTVCCPACQRWHHQEPTRNCWTYAATCAVCGQPTPLDAGYRWTPQAED